MANSKKKCKHCKEYFEAIEGKQLPIGFFCSISHALYFAEEKNKQKAERQKAKNKKMNDDFAKVAKLPKAKQKEHLMSRTDWYDKLQKLVNQWVVHVRDVNEGCCTCGTTKPSIKYDAGHCLTVGGHPEKRFYLRNIHKQCSVNCNIHGSGKRAEYEKFIIEKYGQEELDFLIGPHPTLKEQFPHTEDIKAEILRYRKILRDNGLTPRA